MSLFCNRWYVIVLLSVATGIPVQGQAPQNEKPVRRDLYGDPLPPNAIARLGVARFRHGEPVSSVAFSPDGKTLVSASSDHEVHQWDVATGKELHFLPGHPGQTSCVAFSPDGKFLASSGADCQIRIEDVGTGRELHQLTGHRHRVKAMSFSGNGQILASADAGVRFRLWDTTTGNLLHELMPTAKDGHDYGPIGVGERGVDSVRAVLSPDGKLLAGGYTFRPIWIWDVQSGRLLHKCGASNGSACPLAFSPDSKTIATFDAENRIHLWEAATARDLGAVGERQNIVQLILFSPDGRTLAAAISGVSLWDLSTRNCVDNHVGRQDAVAAIAFSRDGKKLAMGSRGRSIVITELEDDKNLHNLHAFAGHYKGKIRGHFSTNGRGVISTGDDGTLQFWDAATGKRLRAFSWNDGSFFRPTFRVSDDGNTLALRKASGTIDVQDLFSGKKLSELAPDEDSKWLDLAALTANGKFIVSKSPVEEPRQGLVRHPPEMAIDLWDAGTGKTLRRLAKYKTWRTSFVFAPDNRTLAVLFSGPSLDALPEDGSLHSGTLRIWDAMKGREFPRFGKPQEEVGSPAFSSSGRIFACAVNSTTRDLRLGEVITGQQLGRISTDVDLQGGIAFSPDGRVLAFGASDQTIRLWDLAKGKHLGRLTGHRGRITSVEFSMDGKRLVSGSDDTTLLVWDLSSHLPNLAAERVLGDRELEALWTDLSSMDALKAHRALWSLTTVPGQAVLLVQSHLRPDLGVDTKHITTLIKDLDSDQFAVREKAVAGLENLGMLAEPKLREEMTTRPSPEVRRRIERLLEKLDESALWPAASLQALRAAELLERIGSPHARRVLASFAAGTPKAWLTQEMEACLERLAKRPGRTP